MKSELQGKNLTSSYNSVKTLRTNIPFTFFWSWSLIKHFCQFYNFRNLLKLCIIYLCMNGIFRKTQTKSRELLRVHVPHVWNHLITSLLCDLCFCVKCQYFASPSIANLCFTCFNQLLILQWS